MPLVREMISLPHISTPHFRYSIDSVIVEIYDTICRISTDDSLRRAHDLAGGANANGTLAGRAKKRTSSIAVANPVQQRRGTSQ